eukprot:2014102-Amphidinium_carterae.1
MSSEPASHHVHRISKDKQLSPSLVLDTAAHDLPHSSYYKSLLRLTSGLCAENTHICRADVCSRCYHGHHSAQVERWCFHQLSLASSCRIGW